MSDYPGILYFYSESAGLGANAICALLAAVTNFSIAINDDINASAFNNVNGVFFFVVGGLVQLACSARSFRSYDHFSSTVFGFLLVNGLGRYDY